jgi:hypothetical protein
MPSSIRLKIVPPPKAGEAVLRKKTKDITPFFSAAGEMKWVCGSCRHVLAKGMTDGELKAMILKCPLCGSYNQAG